MQNNTYSPKCSYMRVATACPEIGLADVAFNAGRIADLYTEALQKDAIVVVFPEMSLTGYTIGDLVQQSALLDRTEEALLSLAKLTKDKSCAMVVGFPMRAGNGLYDCAALCANGKIQGIVPKSNLPTYSEFYEDRWYQTFEEKDCLLQLGGESVPFGTNLLFDFSGTLCAIEICEDLWVHKPPSGDLAEYGATIILNPSASPEQIGKSDYRRQLVNLQSGRLIAGYLYAGCDVSESTSEIVMGGHQMIAANGHMLAERLPFSTERLLIADVDIEHLGFDRRKHHMKTKTSGKTVLPIPLAPQQKDLIAIPGKNPFLPEEGDNQRSDRLKTALAIQAQGLAARMKATKQSRIVLGLSGGLDSTLALLVANEASCILGIPAAKMIHTLTMPGPASTERTQTNAKNLAAALGVTHQMIPIDKLVAAELEALDHDAYTQDVTYENIQARVRTNLLFNYANMHGCIVLGTGDLSEIALGWCTYNADQQSHYNVNASVPKTMVRHLIAHLAQESKYSSVARLLKEILDTPISPELTKGDGDVISQATEDIIGPYELHDFFLYHLIRWGDTAEKILFLTKKAFHDLYTPDVIERWFNVFVTRFTYNQFKRETLPNGPKVGSVSLSPRGDWRMPPDISGTGLWQTGNTQ
ncbi:MAG: NAD(+) synthase [Firmicutes bacterium]|nr:NAD(+) synthase [Bacillota bacterium]